MDPFRQSLDEIRTTTTSLDDFWEEFLPPDVLDMLHEGRQSLALPLEVIGHPELVSLFKTMRSLTCQTSSEFVEECLRAGAIKHIRILLGSDLSLLPANLIKDGLWALTNIVSGSSETTHEAIQQGALDVITAVIDWPDAPLTILEQTIWCIANMLGDGPEIGYMCIERFPALFTTRLREILDDLLDNHAQKVTDSIHREVISNVGFCMTNLGRIKVDFKRGAVAMTHLEALGSCLRSIMKHADYLIHFDPKSFTNSPYCQNIGYLSSSQGELAVETLWTLSSISEAVGRLDSHPLFNTEQDPITSVFFTDAFAMVMKNLFLQLDREAKTTKRVSNKMISPIIRTLGNLSSISHDVMALSSLTHEITPWLISYFIEGTTQNGFLSALSGNEIGEISWLVSNYVPSIRNVTPDLDNFQRLKYLEMTAYSITFHPYYRQEKPFRELMWVMHNILDHHNRSLMEPLIFSLVFLEIIHAILCFPIKDSLVTLIQDILSKYQSALLQRWCVLHIDDKNSKEPPTQELITLKQLIIIYLNIYDRFDIPAFFALASEEDQPQYTFTQESFDDSSKTNHHHQSTHSNDQDDDGGNDQKPSLQECRDDGHASIHTTALAASDSINPSLGDIIVDHQDKITSVSDEAPLPLPDFPGNIETDFAVSFNLPYTILDDSPTPSPGKTYTLHLQIKRFAEMGVPWKSYIDRLLNNELDFDGVLDDEADKYS